jgi:hypothetical protein
MTKSKRERERKGLESPSLLEHGSNDPEDLLLAQTSSRFQHLQVAP